MKQQFEAANEMLGQNENPDNFIRRGKVGGHKEDMSEEFAKRFDEWMTKGPKKY